MPLLAPAPPPPLAKRRKARTSRRSGRARIGTLDRLEGGRVGLSAQESVSWLWMGTRIRITAALLHYPIYDRHDFLRDKDKVVGRTARRGGRWAGRQVTCTDIADSCLERSRHLLKGSRHSDPLPPVLDLLSLAPPLISTSTVGQFRLFTFHCELRRRLRWSLFCGAIRGHWRRRPCSSAQSGDGKVRGER